jgi:hypothetical protein
MVAEKRETASIRAYAETVEAMKDEQVVVRKAGMTEPTYADLIEAAWQEYRKEERPMLVPSRTSRETKRLHMMLDYLLEAGAVHAEVAKANLEERMAAAVIMKDFPRANIESIVNQELTAFADRNTTRRSKSA